MMASRFGQIISRLKAHIETLQKEVEVAQAAVLALQEADQELQAMTNAMKRIKAEPTIAKYMADSALAFINEGVEDKPQPAKKEPSTVCPRCGVKGLKGCFRNDCAFRITPNVGKAE